MYYRELNNRNYSCTMILHNRSHLENMLVRLRNVIDFRKENRLGMRLVKLDPLIRSDLRRDVLRSSHRDRSVFDPYD